MKRQHRLGRPLLTLCALLLSLIGPAMPALQFQETASAAPSAILQTRSSDPLRDMADAFLVEQDGGWFCPHNPALESSAVCPADTNEGTDSRTFAEYLIEHIVANPGLATPSYLRAGKARNDCSIVPGATCTTGVPAPATCMAVNQPPATYTVTTPYCALKGLKDLGVQLGVVVGAAGDEDGGVKPPRSVKDITYHACRINQADTSNLYDFMFLDLAFKLQDADLIEVVQKIQSGRYWNPAANAYQDCPYGKWNKLITNDTTWPQRTLATGAWGHAKAFKLLELTDWQTHAHAAANGNEPEIRTEDWDFIFAVHTQDPGAHPVLRFEVPNQTNKFAQLSTSDQCSLFRRWAKQQKQNSNANYHFSIIYAFYVHALSDKPETYDSVYRGTFRRQRELIHNYNPDLQNPPPLSACPQ